MKTKKQLTIDTFSTESKLKPKLCYNISLNDEISGSSGVTVAKFPTSLTDMSEIELDTEDMDFDKIKGVAYFKQYFKDVNSSRHRILLYCDDEKIYINQLFYGLSEVIWLYNLEFDSAPVTFAYKKNDTDSIILASENKMVVWHTNYLPYTITDVPIITSMCMNEGVLFCTVKEPAFKVWYATTLDAESVGEINESCNYISLEDNLGDAEKILTFDESVYVFREYGISKINYVKKDISVSQVYLSNSRIYADTVNICGNVIVFMTKDGLYTFNGVKVSKLDIDLTDLISQNNDNARSASLDTRYFLALKMDFNDGKAVLCESQDYVNNALLVIDISDLTYQIIRGVDIGSLLAVKTETFEKILLTFNSGHDDKLGQIVNNSVCFSDNLPKYLLTEPLNENISIKQFTKLTVDSSANVSFKLIFDDDTKTFTTDKAGISEFTFKVSSRQISLEISSSAEAIDIKRIILDYYEYGD